MACVERELDRFQDIETRWLAKAKERGGSNAFHQTSRQEG